MGGHATGQWRPIGTATATPPEQRSRPLAPVGEPSPPKPVARSTDSFEILPSHSLKVLNSPPAKESAPPPGSTADSNSTPEEPRKLIANIPEAVLASLRSTCAAKAEVSLLGRIHGKHPGLKALTAWARDTLHPSLTLLSLKTNNLFEVTFAQPEGRIHALTQAELVCDTANIFFSSWRPHLDPKTAEEGLDHPVWVQIVDLCQVLREESFLQLIGEQLGQVISIDSSEAYRAKLYGPRIRLLVRDLHQLPQTVVIPRLDGEGTVEYKLEFSGLPKQCGRCRALDHLVRNCPRRSPPVNKKKAVRNRGVEARKELPQETEPVETSSGSNKSPPIQPGRSPEQLRPQQDRPPPILDKPGLQEHAPPQSEHRPAGSKETEAGGSPQPNTHPESPCTLAPNATPVRQEEPNISALQPDDINFPRLQTPATGHKGSSPNPAPDHSNKQFVWNSSNITTPATKSQTTEGSRDKEKAPDSAPLTRQGYRSGRLAEDFWSMLGMPNTPSSNHKLLRVIPFLTKNRHTEQPEYLVDRRGQSFGTIAYVHIAELLAGIPWTQSRARQHVVNEVSQALHRILVFNNNLSNPFQKWIQGRWYAQWGQGAEGEHICTMFVSIDVPEHKVKPRKGFQLGWRKEPVEISAILASQGSEDIQTIDPDQHVWQKMAGKLTHKNSDQPPPESHNRFASLLDDEVTSNQ